MKTARLWMNWGRYYMGKIKPTRGQVYEYVSQYPYIMFKYVILNVDKKHHIVEVFDLTNYHTGTMDYKSVIKESKLIETIDPEMVMALYDS